MSLHDVEVGRWAAELLGSPVDIEPLAGGANNHLFHCRGPNGTLVIKRYHEQNFGAEVSRRQAELAFLRHAETCAKGFTPALKGVHDTLEMIAMTAIGGEPYRESEPVPAAAVRAALTFYRQLNADRELVAGYSIAAREGYLSISDHLEHVEKRVSSLDVAHLPADLRQAASAAVGRLRACFDAARDRLLGALAAGKLADRIGSEETSISPGDFGFHNALAVQGTPVFLDFEYAGLDDPAKTLADFFLQPRVPVDGRFFDEAAEAMALGGDTNRLKDRALMLGQLLAAKWQAIILAPLDPRRYPAFSRRYGANRQSELLRRLQLSARESRFG